MNIKHPLSLIIVAAVISILIGVVFGIVASRSIDPNGSDDDETDVLDEKVILNNDATVSADTVWDPLHHNLIDLDGIIEGRVIMIEMAMEDEADQYHFLLLPDLEFKGMVNEENNKNFRGAIMVEIMKGDDFILPRLFVGQHLEVQGPHVTDVRDGHGWNEIDPAIIITEI